MIANFNTEQSEALNVVACIHQLLSEKGSDGPYDDGDDDGDDDDEYSLKVGMVCFSASGRCFANEPPAIQKARQWAKVLSMMLCSIHKPWRQQIIILDFRKQSFYLEQWPRDAQLFFLNTQGK